MAQRGANTPWRRSKVAARIIWKRYHINDINVTSALECVNATTASADFWWAKPAPGIASERVDVEILVKKNPPTEGGLNPILMRSWRRQSNYAASRGISPIILCNDMYHCCE
jgi:hypothetical protein